MVEEELIFVGALEAQSLKRTLGEGIIKMFSGSLVVLKGIRYNNLYYLKGNAVTGDLAASEHLDENFTRLWQVRLGHVGIDSSQALMK